MAEWFFRRFVRAMAYKYDLLWIFVVIRREVMSVYYEDNVFTTHDLLRERLDQAFPEVSAASGAEGRGL